MKWLVFFIAPCLLFGSAQEALFDLFGISNGAAIETVLPELQELWMQSGKERWHFEKRYESLKGELWPIFEELKMVHTIPPKLKHYETAVVLGALYSTVESRVAYLIESGVSYDALVFLTGQRPLLESELELLPNCVTETDMVRWVYEHSSLPKNLPVTFIDAPKNGKERPNTYDTVIEWLKTEPNPESCLVISNQPYVQYQNAVLSRFLPFGIETVGRCANNAPSVALMLDTFAREMTVKYGGVR